VDRDLGRRGRTEWVSEEMDVLTSPNTYKLEPENATWRISLAQYLLESGDVHAASKVIEGIDTERLDLRVIKPDTKARLDAIRKQLRANN